jgi:hypothetical protein
MSRKQTTVTIDWLAHTLHRSTEALTPPTMSAARALAAYHATGQKGGWAEAPGRNGYMYRLVSADREGLEVQMCDGSDRQGVHVVWTGRALSDVNLEDRLKFANLSTGKVTRLDIALDVAEKLDFRAFYEAGKAGKLSKKAKACKIIEQDEGCTVYIGSRTSGKMLRVYDKQAEQGTREEWTRLELECKGDDAQAISFYLCNEGLHNIPAIIRAFCDWPGDERWAAIFDAIPKIGVPKREKVTDRDKWLREQVMPVLRAETLNGRVSAWEVLKACWEGMDEAMRHEFNAWAWQDSEVVL